MSVPAVLGVEVLLLLCLCASYLSLYGPCILCAEGVHSDLSSSSGGIAVGVFVHLVSGCMR